MSYQDRVVEEHLRLILLLDATLRRLFPDIRLSLPPPSMTSPDTLLSLSPPWTLIPETLRSLTEAASNVPPDILRSRPNSLSSCLLSKLLGPLSPLKKGCFSLNIYASLATWILCCNCLRCHWYQPGLTSRASCSASG